MDFIPTKEQESIIGADLVSQCVIACPGSGKTATAVRRLIEIRRRLADQRGYVALFSYSNIAVETFRREYSSLAKSMPTLSPRVVIGTMDSFITTFILRPHGARIMGTSRLPFLVRGSEPFLNSFKIFDGKYPRDIRELRVRIRHDGTLDYVVQAPGKQPVQIEEWKALAAINKLGKTGAYTHELARYWAIRVLAEDERLLKVVSRRFPHILVDEAQDVGPLHGTLITVLGAGGTSASMIGDPNQGIYDFAGADGSFLRDYAKENGVVSFSLSQNRRSVNTIVGVANLLAGTASTPFRNPGHRKHGAYYLRYNEDDLDGIMAAFSSIVETNGYSKTEAVVVCRGNATVARLTGGGTDVGRGATEQFARAAVLRDRNSDIASAFECVVLGLLRLLQDPPDVLRRDLLSVSAEGDVKMLRRLLWAFLRTSATGLPESKLSAKSKWHPILKKRLAALLTAIEAKTSFTRLASWVNNVTVSELSDSPLWEADLAGKDTSGVRSDTVHQVKGEGIPVVLYLARTAEITKMLEGTVSEEGRIGYVAVTRAKDLLLLGVPDTAKKSMITALESKGFIEWIN